MKKTYTADDRKEQLIEIGARLAAKVGVVNVQRQAVADKAGCAHSLVSVYLGDTKKAQAAYKRRMKKLGLVEPSKEVIAAKGVELRKHKVGDKRDTRKRSGKEVEAIKRKKLPALAKAVERKPLIPPARKPTTPPSAKPSAPPATKPTAPPATKAERVPGELDFTPPVVLMGAFP